MKKGLIFLLFFFSVVSFSQESNNVSGTILNSKNNLPLENVNIVNLNKVIGTATSKKGEFEINAQVDDTLHFSYLGFKSIKVRVTNDWIKFGTNTVIELTELALALEEIGITRYGERKRSLFKTPPVENMKINGFDAKYVMITGDKDISPNKETELIACTDEQNTNGEKVKVIIISRAGSEGLDFQNIRQVHILEPWFNLNRLDQIIE